MTTILQDLESARNFGDTMRLRDRIMAETDGAEQDGYLKSLDCLETLLEQEAMLAEYEREQQWAESDSNNPEYHRGF